MGKKWILLLVFLMVLGCKKKEGGLAEVVDESGSLTFQNMPKVVPVNENVQRILADWKEFQELHGSFQVLFKAANNEDLALAVADMVEKEKALAVGPYPTMFDTSQIKSRQRVFKTFLLKIQASVADRTDVYGPIKEMLLAYNAMRRQFNVIENNKLDLKSILEES